MVDGRYRIDRDPRHSPAAEYDTVGVWVHSQDKAGKDAGVLANGEPIGLATTNSADALIALKPDCVIYAASGPERDALAIPDYVKLPRADFGARAAIPPSIPLM